MFLDICEFAKECAYCELKGINIEKDHKSSFWDSDDDDDWDDLEDDFEF